MSAAHPDLEPLALGFRERYLHYDELTEQLKSWADAFPELVRLESIGKSREGRELWLLTVGPDPDQVRPAVWVDGNMHAGELAGSSVALAIAEEALALHLSPPDPDPVPGPVRRAAQQVLFHVLPRMSPDGAEAVLDTGRYVRSVPRDERPDRNRPRWVADDVDGDGECLAMRQLDPTGEWVDHPEYPGVLVPRTVEDEGPFYKVYPEGHVEHWDGHSIPDADFLGDNHPDLNRNFPWEWSGEHAQHGAGSHPGSEPEAAAVIEQASRRPNLFAWLNLHTFGGVLIRPPGNQPDEDMDQKDLAVYRQVEHWAEELTGYPMVSGYEEFLYRPNEIVRGALAEWAYVERGCLAWVTELWDIFARLDMERPPRFVDYYSRMSREDIGALAEWDREDNGGRVFRAWRPFRHPQLGLVELGGVDPRVGLQNPSYEALPEICAQHSQHLLRVAAMAPRVVVADIAQRRTGDVTTLTAVVENRGYLPTHGVHAAKSHPFAEPLWADVICEGGVSLAHEDEAHREIGHLQGWGRGRFDLSQAIFFQRSQGSVSRRTLRWTLHGSGEVKLVIGGCRTGWIEQRVTIGEGST
ncbi:MAG: M14 family metallopeptidase [Myxococcota bacterium]|nr:M14 family metallopeptidase [Myxococcota bacterium]